MLEFRLAPMMKSGRPAASGPAGTRLAFAAEQLSFGHLAGAVEDATGQPCTRQSLGTVDDLRQAIAGARCGDIDPAAPAMLVYMLFMLTGQIRHGNGAGR